ncbi:MAG: hemerythrin domain-containing protein [Phycisphaerales bacterium]|nr:MAG: hemerythrin domain-containing protein [Phycisphaerales bacterium]
MDTTKVAECIRDEHRRVQELADRLHERTGVAPRADFANWIEDVRDRFDHFRAHMVKHMALEESDGYMTAVKECRPTLANEVERLKREHNEMMKIMDSIHYAVHGLCEDDRLLMRDCCARIENLLSYIEHHDSEETLMVTSAFTRDLGAND